MARLSNSVSISVSTATPAWFSSLANQTWTAISGNTISSVAPTLSDGIINAWCGGSLDPAGYKYYITNQGGHATETKGHVLEFDLTTALWTLRKGPIAHGGTTTTMSDGGPACSHSEDQICYVPPVNGRTTGQIVHTTLPFFNFNNGGSDGGIYAYSLSGNTWSGRLTAASLFTCAGGSAYDSSRDLVWIMSLQSGTPVGTQGSLVTWNPQSPTTSPVTRYSDWGPAPSNNNGYLTQLTYSPTKDCLVSVNGAGGNWLYVVNCASPGTGYASPTTSGSGPTTAGLGGMWSSNANSGQGAFIFGRSTTTTLYKLTPPAGAITGTWTWSSIAGSGSLSSPSGTYNGTFGRLQLFENVFGSGRDVILVVNQIGGAVYAYKTPIGGL